MSRRTLASIATLAVTVTTLAACSSQIDGKATPSALSPPPASSSPATTASNNPFTGMNQCTTLDQLLTGQGFGPAAPSPSDRKHVCAAQKPLTNTEDPIDASLGFYPGQKINENINNPAKAKPGKINGNRPAVLQQEPLHSRGMCEIGMQVATDSRINLLVVVGTDTERACQLVQGLAEKVDPLLPKA
ncbi:DUF3558 family protein [Amycolatopsis samaneae]|uniref:DUF3558 family protein n=1 Tax=Amycolatopsis samaneae TaxID=664691 RepID=A0ABW5GIX5_9PSEU